MKKGNKATRQKGSELNEPHIRNLKSENKGSKRLSKLLHRNDTEN
jgi:hypothetical protein